MYKKYMDMIKRQDNGQIIPMISIHKPYQDYLLWLSEGNTPEPEFTQAELDTQEQARVNAESLAYLASTDWYVIREQETGVAIPADVLALRAEARLAVV